MYTIFKSTFILYYFIFVITTNCFIHLTCWPLSSICNFKIWIVIFKLFWSLILINTYFINLTRFAGRLPWCKSNIFEQKTIPLYTMFAELRTLIELGNSLRFNQTHVGHKKLENCASRAQQPPLKTTDIQNRTKLPSNVKGKQVNRGSF
jgi:hypothetical protein